MKPGAELTPAALGFSLSKGTCLRWRCGRADAVIYWPCSASRTDLTLPIHRLKNDDLTWMPEPGAVEGRARPPPLEGRGRMPSADRASGIAHGLSCVGVWSGAGRCSGRALPALSRVPPAEDADAVEGRRARQRHADGGVGGNLSRC